MPRQSGAEVAANSELSWTPDGTKLFVALRSPADDAAAQAAFKTLVAGPVVVQSSKPFLDWDAMSRANRRRVAGGDRSRRPGRASVVAPPARSRTISSPATDRS